MNLFNKDIFKKEIFKKDMFKDGLKTITNPLMSFANSAKSILTSSDDPNNHISDLVFVYPRIFWMTYPSPEKIKGLSNTLNAQFKNNNYYVWNVGEQKYDTSLFNNQVAEFSFVGYPCPPFQYILLICKSVLEWLNNDKDNVVIIHCNSSAGRSAVVISCLLSLIKVVNHPMEALTYFCNKLKINDDSFLLPSQKLSIKNFANLMDNLQLNSKPVIIEKIVISEAPKVEVATNKSKNEVESEELKPYIQIFKGSKAIFNYLSKEKNLKVYKPGDQNLEFQIGLEVTDDVLIRCRNYKSNTERTSIFRILFSPGLTFGEEVKLYKRDIDFTNVIISSENFYVEIVLSFGEKENPDVEVIKKLRDDCFRLVEQYKQKKDKAAQKIVQAQSEEDVKNKFDIFDYSKENSEENNEHGEDSSKHAELLTPGTNDKLNKFFTSIQQEDETTNEEEKDEEDLDDYLRKLEEK